MNLSTSSRPLPFCCRVLRYSCCLLVGQTCKLRNTLRTKWNFAVFTLRLINKCLILIPCHIHSLVTINFMNRNETRQKALKKSSSVDRIEVNTKTARWNKQDCKMCLHQCYQLKVRPIRVLILNFPSFPRKLFLWKSIKKYFRVLENIFLTFWFKVKNESSFELTSNHNHNSQQMKQK